MIWLPIAVGIVVSSAIWLLGGWIERRTDGRYDIGDVLFGLVFGIPVIGLGVVVVGAIFWTIGAIILSLLGVRP